MANMDPTPRDLSEPAYQLPLDPPHTRAAEGLERLAFSLADVHRMMAIDVLSPEGAWELLAGEIVWMSPAIIRHGRLATRLSAWFVTHLPASLQCIADVRVDIPPNSQPGPDIVVFDAAYDGEGAVPIDRVRLVIEVANTTLAKDLGLKAQIYAEAGVADYWVVDAQSEQLIVHRGPMNGAWAQVTRHGFGEPVSPLCAPGLGVTIAAL